ncbi:prolyl oligopeptidase family serine peptidase [Phormidesmis priestleyi]
MTDRSVEQIWQSPPDPIAPILDAPLSPAVSISPDHKWLIELERSALRPLAELAEPELGLAGFRINPKLNSPARYSPYKSLRVKPLLDGVAEAIALPDHAGIGFVRWSPDSQKLAFALVKETGLELWVMDLLQRIPQRLTAPILNATYGTPYRWMTDRSLLCKLIPSDRSTPPIEPVLPPGPIIQENLGRKSANRTYTNLLQNAHDESLFDYYLTSTLEQVTIEGTQTVLVKPSLIKEAIPSPDGKFILLKTLHRPFSYQLPASRFPCQIQVLDDAGTLIQEIADLPLADRISTKFDAVRPGRRSTGWRSDRPSTVSWIEALDEGDPTQNVPFRDALFQLNAPFDHAPQLLWQSQFRFRRILWGREDVALTWEKEYDSRKLRLWQINPAQPETPPHLLIDRSSEDQYSDPGMPITTIGKYHRSVLRFTPDGDALYFSGRGASPDGIYPFLDRRALQTAVSERLWQCQAPYFESIVTMLDDAAQTLITARQSQTEPPNYFLRPTTGQPIPLTAYPDPAPQFAGIHKEVVQYQRADGVQLSAKLYLPAGYDPSRDGPLPTIFWVYPAEFKDKTLAGQITTAENTFSRPYGASALFLLTQGYAILDDPSLPIVGEGDAEPNDTYLEQLISSVEAAINYLVHRGVSDRNHLGIGGHSYGGFTTANLLAHTNLFQAGIARSGAYNRSLTPFGFQGEQRTFWEAIETYNQMSPFTHAAQITAPLLLIHGANDSNPGTYPLQTERLYEALKGLGATVRWVSLPLEDHGYRSREAVGHVLWEMVRWCDRYVKKVRSEE